MNRGNILRFVGAALMFGVGYMGSQSAEWAWISAGLALVFVLVMFWLKSRVK